MTRIVEKDLSFKITGICFQIHNEFGRFLTEKQYCDALARKLDEFGIGYVREPSLSTEDNSEQTIYIGRPDLIIDDKIIVDVKAKKFITKSDYNQMMKYLTLIGRELGMIINFRASYLKPKRVLNPSFYSEHSGVHSNHSGRSKGFTLIESVVAISVFAITATSIVGVYTAVQKLNQQSAALQALQQNGRFITEDLTKIIRNGQIDYASYSNQQVPQPAAVDLYLLDQFGTQIHVSRDGDDLIMDKTGIGSTTFSGREVRVLAFQVYIWPDRNPFGGGGAQEQPTVTIFLDLESNINPRDRVRLPFQVSVSTRQYPQ